MPNNLAGDNLRGNKVTVGVERTGAAVLVTLDGEVDMLTGPAVQAELVELVATASTELVVVDLSEVSFFSSRGIQMVVEIAGLAAEHHTVLRLVIGTNRALLRLLQITGLDTEFEVFATRADALSAEPRANGASAATRAEPTD